MEVSFKLESFEGPMDLLLKLIEKNKIDIYDIPIALLTDQYMAYLDTLQAEKMDNMSEFIVMASKLLKIKSRMLLPKAQEEAEEEDPREELVARLIEYKLFKQLAQSLGERKDIGSHRYFGQGDSTLVEGVKRQVNVDMQQLLQGVTPALLDKTFNELMQRVSVKPNKAKAVARAVYIETFKIEEKIDYIQNLIKVNKKVPFKGLFRNNSTKTEIVVTFMAMLELIKTARVAALQEEAFGDIIIYGV